MIEQLTPLEARVLGSLVEKSLTTPELYPLTLNSLVNACNQKTSRDPVMTVGHNDVERALNGLVERKLAARIHEPGARAAKHTHRIDILLGSEDPKVVGAVTILLLRGPQTPGEIKGRTERLCRFESTAEVEALMAELSGRVDGPIVSRLSRQPGQKETRYQHLFTASMGSPAVSEVPPAPAGRTSIRPAPSPEGGSPPLPEGSVDAGPDRIALLEARVAALEAALDELRPK